MKDIQEFSKLFKLKIPVDKYWEYYCSTLHESKEFSDMYRWFDFFNDLERTENVLKYRVNCLSLFKNRISSTDAYRRFLEANIPDSKKVNSVSEEDNRYISIDIEKANWSILKIFDFSNELPESWADLCKELSIHPAIAESKSFRQVVFGNLNPNRNAKIQSHLIGSLSQNLIHKGYRIKCSTDEIQVGLTFDDRFSDIEIEEIFTKDVRENFLASIGADVLRSVPLRKTKFSLIKKSGTISLKSIYKNDNVDYVKLVGVPGNEYHLYFKPFILGLPLEERDMLFTMDGRIARWVELPEVVQRRLDSL